MLSNRTLFSRFYSPDDGGGGGSDDEVVVTEAASAFEDGDDLDVVIIDPNKREEVKEPEPSPNVSLEALLASQSETSKALAAGLAGLGEGLKRQPANVPQPTQQIGETDDEFYKRIEEELYRPGGAGKALQEATARQMGPLVAAFQKEILDTKKQLLVHDPELGSYYKRFKAEVDERVAATPRNRIHGEIYRETLQAVMAEKGPELQAETVAEMVKKGIEEGLRSAGIDPNGSKAKATPPVAVSSLGGRGGAVEAKREPARERLEFTNRDIENMIARGLISEAKDVRKDSPYIDNIRAYGREKARKADK